MMMDVCKVEGWWSSECESFDGQGRVDSGIASLPNENMTAATDNL